MIFRSRLTRLSLLGLGVLALGAAPALAKEGVGDLVFEDINNNGVRDAGERGIPGVTVSIDTDNGSGIFDPVTSTWSGAPDCLPDNLPAYPGRTTVTNADGAYFFSGVGQGNFVMELVASNFVAAGPLAGYTSSTGSVLTTGPYEPGIAESGNVADNNRDHGTAAGGRIRVCNVDLRVAAEPVGEGPTPGIVLDDPDESQNTTVDFGVFKPTAPSAAPGTGSVGGIQPSWTLANRVWSDIDRDGIQDKGEPGVPNVVASLFDKTGRVVGSATTDTLGNYRMAGIIGGSFQIGLSQLPLGAAASPFKAGKSRAFDSDHLRSSRRTPAFTIKPGTSRSDLDAGLIVPTGFAGRVWRDSDANGQQDGNEAGVRRVRVTLISVATGRPVGVTTTSSKGKFSFLNIRPGSYRVTVTAPKGSAFTLRNQGSDLTDSDVGVATGRTAKMTVRRGLQVVTVGAGLK